MELFWQKYNFLLEIIQFDYEPNSHFDDFIQLTALNFGDLCVEYATTPQMCAFYFYKLDELPFRNVNDEFNAKLNNIKNKLIKV